MKDRWVGRYARRGRGWSAEVPVRDDIVRVSARSLEGARMALTAALADALGQRDGWIAIDDDIDLSTEATDALARARTRRTEALRAAAESQTATRVAACALVRDGLSLRDTAYLLGLSHSRIQQLIEHEGSQP